jgi:hypothetical protein
MVVISPQAQAAEMRRREFVAQGIHEQWVDQVLVTGSPRDTGLSPRSSLVISLQIAACSTRSLLTSLATGALGLTTNGEPSPEKGAV